MKTRVTTNRPARRPAHAGRVGLLIAALLVALATACTDWGDGDDPDDPGDLHGATDVRGWPLDEAEREFARCPNIQLKLNPYDPADLGIERSLVVVRDQRVGLAGAAVAAWAAPRMAEPSATSDGEPPPASSSGTPTDGVPTDTPVTDEPVTDTVTPSIADDPTPPPPPACPPAEVIVSLDLGVHVPQLVDLTVEESQDELDRLGLHQRVVGPDDDDQSVRRQDPAPLAVVELGSDVLVETVEIATNGPSSPSVEAVPVPDVVGMGENEACAVLRELGFGCRPDPQIRPGERSGVVRQQGPLAGARVNADSTVTIYVERPPVAEVPAVTGSSEKDACAAIAAAGLVCEAVVDNGDGQYPGSVESQSPDPGALVEPASLVTVWVHRQPLPVRVPSVQGLHEDEACRTIEEAGFRCDRLPWQEDGPDGQVMHQSPGQGEEAIPGEAIRVYIARDSGWSSDTIWTIALSALGVALAALTIVVTVRLARRGRGKDQTR